TNLPPTPPPRPPRACRTSSGNRGASGRNRAWSSCPHPLILRGLVLGGRRPSRHRARRALHGRLYAEVGHAPAQGAGHALANLGVGRVRVLVEERLRRQDLAVLAEPAR